MTAPADARGREQVAALRHERALDRHRIAAPEAEVARLRGALRDVVDQFTRPNPTSDGQVQP